MIRIPDGASGRAIGFLGLALSLCFSFLVYPQIAGPLQNSLTQDGYDLLGRGIVATGSLAYFPQQYPTVMRGPLYPAIVAVSVAAGDVTDFVFVRSLQSAFHGLTAWLTFHLGLLLFDRRTAQRAGMLAALHPLLLWYAARVTPDSLTATAWTAAAVLFVHLLRRPDPAIGAGMGLVLGAASLLKQTFLPFAVLLPLLAGHRSRSWVPALLSLTAALTVVTPWTARNHALTGMIIPVHSLLGYNMRVGDSFARNYGQSPFGYLFLVSLRSEQGPAAGDTVHHVWMQAANAADGARMDSHMAKVSFNEMARDPGWALRKIALGAVMFWTLASTPTVSAVVSAFQVPLALTMAAAIVLLALRRRLGSPAGITLVCCALYMALHLPVYSIARFGVPLIPVLLTFAAAAMCGSLSRPGARTEVATLGGNGNLSGVDTYPR